MAAHGATNSQEHLESPQRHQAAAAAQEDARALANKANPLSAEAEALSGKANVLQSDLDEFKRVGTVLGTGAKVVSGAMDLLTAVDGIQDINRSAANGCRSDILPTAGRTNGNLIGSFTGGLAAVAFCGSTGGIGCVVVAGVAFSYLGGEAGSNIGETGGEVATELFGIEDDPGARYCHRASRNVFVWLTETKYAKRSGQPTPSELPVVG